MSNQTKYRAFCRNEPCLPVFSKDWWLDAVCGEAGWDVALVEKGDQIIGTMPFPIGTGKSTRTIKMPSLTQTLGPYLKYPAGQSHEDRLGYEKRVLTALIDGLPPFDEYFQRFHYSVTNWLPFYWRGFEQTTRYTYVIQDLTDLEAVFASFSHAKRKNLKKAEKEVVVKYDLPAREFFENHRMTLAGQNASIQYSWDLFQRIHNAGYAHDSARTIYAVDPAGNLHAALFVIWDGDSAYDLISTIDPRFRNSGAATLLIREIIRDVAKRTRRFDFEGSMIEGVENSFRQFGTTQTPFSQITKVNSRWLRFRKCCRALLKTPASPPGDRSRDEVPPKAGASGRGPNGTPPSPEGGVKQERGSHQE